MSRYGAAPLAQAQTITAEILEPLRRLVPQLHQYDQAHAFEFLIKIRNGVVETLDTLTWDDQTQDIRHAKPDETDKQLNRLETWLLRDLPNRLIPTYHGYVLITVTVKEKTVSFGCKIMRQRKFTWRQDGTSAT